MLNLSVLHTFYFFHDFHDMRCKYDRVLSVIHQQLNREPENGDIFIVLSKNSRLVRWFSYDHRSYSLFERRFMSGYSFMQVVHDGGELIYFIDWKSVAFLRVYVKIGR